MRGVGPLQLLLLATACAVSECRNITVPDKQDLVPYNVFSLRHKGDFVEVAEVPLGKRNDENEEARIFCHKGQPAKLTAFWSTAAMKLDINSIDYQVYVAKNKTHAAELIKSSQSEWFFSQVPWRHKEFKFTPFEETCVGVMSPHAYNITMQFKTVNYISVLFTLAGTTLFFMSPTLCRNVFFHYTTGIGMGLMLSLFILTFLIQRRFKQNLFSWVGLLYSLSLYFLTNTWYNVKEYFTDQYYHWVVGYVLLVGIVSFMVIYRLGPPENPKTLNLIQWCMQGGSLLMIVMSSYDQATAIAFCLVLITWKCIPASWKAKFRTQYRKQFFKPKVHLLTEEEYLSQAATETRKALNELRDYCKSPDCNQWKTVSRLISPGRFAEFVEGSPHLTEDEVMEYSQWEYTDDENDERSGEQLTDDEETGHANSSFDDQN